VATFENTVVISRPIEQVFGFLSDFENVPKWNYAILETRKVSQGAVGVGTIYQQVRSVPKRSEERFEVTAYNPPRHLEIRGQLGPFPARLSYALDALAEGTRVTNSVELELRGPGRLGRAPSSGVGEGPPHSSLRPAMRSRRVVGWATPWCRCWR
jgi:uncharacterized protein YndB with AHSA1/START domain